MEPQSLSKPETKAVNKVLLLIGVLFVSFNLRPAITSVGPLISAIRDDLGISNSIAGIITTLPLLSFAIFSLVAPKLGYRFGNEMMIFVGLITLAAGILVRYASFTFTLFLGTAFIGVGIAIANVLLPSIVKTKYPGKLGLITGVYTTSMSGFAAIGTGLSIPLSEGLNFGWEKTLLFWISLAIIAIVIWIPQIRRASRRENGPRNSNVLPGTTIWRSPLAWQVTIFMGLQSFLFYSLITWLPAILNNNGLSMTLSGWMVSTLQLAGLPMSFLTPVIATRLKNQQGLIVMISILYISGFVGLLLATSTLQFTISAILIGLGQGSSISLALTMFGLRAANGQQAAELSGMAQSVGYFLAAFGPIIIGKILDVTSSGTIPLFTFIFIAFLKFLAGLGAARDRTVFQ